MEEKELLGDTTSMMRLKLKAKLIKDTSSIFGAIAKARATLPSKYVKVTERTIMRDFRKGLKIIDAKVPVFIELPTLKKEGDGMYSEIKGPVGAKHEKEIVVPDAPMLNNTDIAGLLEQ